MIFACLKKVTLNTLFYHWDLNDNTKSQHCRSLHLFIKVQTRNSKDELAEILDDRIKLRITAVPIDGKANKHLIQFLAKLFGVPEIQYSNKKR